MGPLSGYKIVELAAIGPGPMAAMLLAEMGADVITVDRVQASGLGIDLPAKHNLLQRSRRSLAVDLKNPRGINTVMQLIRQADALIEGFRPGVTERLGLGPQDCQAHNPRLVYGRVTGWGQEGPLARAAGHDLNYIALTGALHSIGRYDQPPTPPLNLVGDFGGGALYLALGIVAALLETQRSGQGQIVDAAMIDGAASLMTAAYGLYSSGVSNQERGNNILDSGAHFYEVYETSDQRYISLAPIEAKFYAELLRLADINPDSLAQSFDREDWPALKARLGEVIKTKTRDQWCEILEGSDVCFAPVLTMDEAARHPHNKARDTFVTLNDVVQPNAAPRFSRTPANIKNPPPAPGEHSRAILTEWGFSEPDITALLAANIVVEADIAD